MAHNCAPQGTIGQDFQSTVEHDVRLVKLYFEQSATAVRQGKANNATIELQCEGRGANFVECIQKTAISRRMGELNASDRC